MLIHWIKFIISNFPAAAPFRLQYNSLHRAYNTLHYYTSLHQAYNMLHYSKPLSFPCYVNDIYHIHSMSPPWIISNSVTTTNFENEMKKEFKLSSHTLKIVKWNENNKPHGNHHLDGSIHDQWIPYSSGCLKYFSGGHPQAHS